MTNSYFDTESAHSNLMYWWHGVIVDDKFWAGCSEDDVSNEHLKLHYADKQDESPKKGWGKRYKVAIVGRHYAIKGRPEEADLLEMAEVVYPVTAGSGLGGSKQTAALRHGAHVLGFYADGKEGREPVILGTFGVNEQNEPSIFQGDPNIFYQLRTGNKGLCGDKLKPVPEKDQNLEKDKKPVESNASPLQATQSHKTKREDGDVVEVIKAPKACDGPATLIDQIKTILKKLSYYINLGKRGASDLISSISGIINSITREITSLTNTLMDRMRGYLINLINAGIKNVMNFLPPFLRPEFNQTAQGALGGLGCAFNNIKNAIAGIVQNLVKQFIDNYVNAPLCAATSFVGSLLGNVLGQVNSAVDGAVGAINSVLDIGSGFADKALDVLDFAQGILKLFECEKDDLKCPDTKKWSFWNGPKELQSNIEEGVSRVVKDIISEVETVLPGSKNGASSNPCNSRQVPCGPPRIQITGGGGSGASANAVVSATGKILGLDFSAFGSGYTYPPQINVVDSCGTGGGVALQPIMEPTGEFNEFQEEILALTGVVVLDSGSQYLPVPNGTSGGSGFIFSQPSDTIHFKTGSTQIINGKEVNGAGYEVYECGTTFDVVAGDEVYLPEGTIADVYGQTGEVVQTIEGLGHYTEVGIQTSGTMTAPCNPDNVPVIPQITYPISSGETIFTSGGNSETTVGTGGTTSDTQTVTTNPTTFTGQPQTVPGALFTKGTVLPSEYINAPISSEASANTTGNGITRIQQVTNTIPNSYPIIATIERVVIKNPGYGYKSTDRIGIVGNKGAELEFDVNERGEVTQVRVINGGLGFEDVPYIGIESQTGYNFEAVAVFKFSSAYDIDLNNVSIPTGSKIISVIDCVGKHK